MSNTIIRRFSDCLLQSLSDLSLFKENAVVLEFKQRRHGHARGKAFAIARQAAAIEQDENDFGLYGHRVLASTERPHAYRASRRAEIHEPRKNNHLAIIF